MELPQIDCYQHLFLQDTPLIDVRAPIEFQQGAFPHATNLPLIDNSERHEIGIRYKQSGQHKAIELGYELVNGELKHQRVASWINFANSNPQGALYCFRGGMRSKISQQWLYEATGVTYPRVKGGYKAMRRFLINELDRSIQEILPVILSGRTGSGKTLLLQRLQDKVDLEHIYQHRGSAFGYHVTAQPSQIDIENQLSIDLLKHRNNNARKIVLEDESAAIGSRRLPDSLLSVMRKSPVVVLETPIDARVEIVFNEYIIDSLAEFQQSLGDDMGFMSWSNSLLSATDKIYKRLGGQQHRAIRSQLEYAITHHRINIDIESHKDWIRSLLLEYYDPMYDYQLAKKIERIQFRGESDAILEYLSRHYAVK